MSPFAATLVNKKRQVDLVIAFLASLLILSLLYLYPAFLQSIGVSNTVLSSQALVELVIPPLQEFFILYILLFHLFFALIARMAPPYVSAFKRLLAINSSRSRQDAGIYVMPNGISALVLTLRRRLWLFLLLILCLFFLGSGLSIESLLTVTGRHFGNKLVVNLILLLSWLFLAISLVGHSRRLTAKDYTYAFFFFVIPTFISGAFTSRGVAVPFLIVSLVYFFRRTRPSFLISFLFAYLAIIAYICSFFARGLGVLPFFSEFCALAVNPLLLLQGIDFLVKNIFPGLDVPAYVSANLAGTSLSDRVNLLAFFIYINPIPQSLMPDGLRFEQSVSAFMGLPLGVYNVDFISDAMLWSPLNWPLFLALVILLMLYAPYLLEVKSLIPNGSSRLLYVLAIYALVAGQSMSIRSASRYYVYVSILLLLFRRVRFRAF